MLADSTSHDDKETSSSKSSKTASDTGTLAAVGIKVPDLEALIPNMNSSIENASDTGCNCSESDATARPPDATIAPAPAQLLYNQTFSNWSILLSQIPVSPSQFLNEKPEGLRLAFVGDSITRYQAVSLMYFLRTGEWYPDELRPSLVAKTDADYGSWAEYLNSTSIRLGQESGNHWCDCYRNDETGVAADPGAIFENRYFRDLEHDNYVYLITKLGWASSRGRWWPSRISDWKKPRSFDGEDSEAKWKYQWGDLIRRHLANLHTKPTHVIFNEGLWKGIGNSTYRDIEQALKGANMTGIYKTTTKRSDEQTPDLEPFDAVGCSMFDCLDLSWTYVLVMQPYYCDYGTHFTSMVYTLFNQQLLGMLKELGLTA